MLRHLLIPGHMDIPHKPKEREDLYQIFDSMDFDGNSWQKDVNDLFENLFNLTLDGDPGNDCFLPVGLRNGTLSTGEWAAGLSVYFKGSMEEAGFRPPMNKTRQCSNTTTASLSVNEKSRTCEGP